MKSYVLLGLLVSFTAHARAGQPAKKILGCYAYGHSFAAGEDDCDGRVCQPDGTWNGVVKSGLCEYPEEETDGRDPASVKKLSKKAKKARKH